MFKPEPIWGLNRTILKQTCTKESLSTPCAPSWPLVFCVCLFIHYAFFRCNTPTNTKRLPWWGRGRQQEPSPCPTGALSLLTRARRRVGYAGSVLWQRKNREGLFFKTAVSMARIMKRQNYESLIDKRGWRASSVLLSLATFVFSVVVIHVEVFPMETTAFGFIAAICP